MSLSLVRDPQSLISHYLDTTLSLLLFLVVVTVILSRVGKIQGNEIGADYLSTLHARWADLE